MCWAGDSANLACNPTDGRALLVPSTNTVALCSVMAFPAERWTERGRWSPAYTSRELYGR